MSIYKQVVHPTIDKIIDMPIDLEWLELNSGTLE